MLSNEPGDSSLPMIMLWRLQKRVWVTTGSEDEKILDKVKKR